MDDLPKLIAFTLLGGFAACFIVATVFAAALHLIWKTRFSWRIILGTSVGLAVMAAAGCFLWIVAAARGTM
jgi:hypothetical protein